MEALQLEQAILERLTAEAQIEGIKAAVELFPDVGDYLLTHPQGAILIRYDSSTDNNDIGTRQFQSTLEFQITIWHRRLREKGAMYELLKFVRESLTGFAPLQYNFLKRTSEEFTTKVGDVWVFGQRYQISTTYLMGKSV